MSWEIFTRVALVTMTVASLLQILDIASRLI